MPGGRKGRTGVRWMAYTIAVKERRTYLHGLRGRKQTALTRAQEASSSLPVFCTRANYAYVADLEKAIVGTKGEIGTIVGTKGGTIHGSINATVQQSNIQKL